MWVTHIDKKMVYLLKDLRHILPAFLGGTVVAERRRTENQPRKNLHQDSSENDQQGYSNNSHLTNSWHRMIQTAKSMPCIIFYIEF